MAKADKSKGEAPGVSLVWAYQELSELDNRTGFVSCESKLATKLLKEDKVQDPKLGAFALKPIGTKDAVKTTKAKSKATKQKVIEDTESK